MGRNSTGVRGMRLDGPEDEAVGMLVMQCNEALSEEQWNQLDAQSINDENTEPVEDDNLETNELEEIVDENASENIEAVSKDSFYKSVMVVSENGFGKRSALEDYRITKRGGKGIKTLNVTEKT